MKTTIKALKNGPYEVSGDELEVVSAKGDVAANQKTVHLCRCGCSKNKPFCDGSHVKCGFHPDD